MCVGHDHSSLGIKSQSHRSTSRVMVVMVSVSKDSDEVGLTSILDRGQFVLCYQFRSARV